MLLKRIAFPSLLLLVVGTAVSSRTGHFIPRHNDVSCAAPSGDAKIAEELGTHLNALLVADEFSGAVLVARKGTALFLGAYGDADKARRIANRSETKFNVGSMSKMFTAVAIAQLAQAGRLDVSDTIGQHLPDYPNTAVASRVTIHHLLTHTSGLGDYLSDGNFGRLRGELKSVNAHFPLFVETPLLFDPGARFRYSNAGYVVLGAVLERVTGRSYFDYVREHIFRPSGMNSTDSYDLARTVPGLATGYTAPASGDGQSRGENTAMLPFKGSPAGGGYSTVEDLLRFGRALRRHKLLGKQYTDLILHGKVDSNFGPGVKYGYGFATQHVCGHLVAGHTGGYAGVSAVFLMYLDQDYTVAVLSNYGEGAAQKVARRARELIAGRWNSSKTR